jgi:hypothetical protein
MRDLETRKAKLDDVINTLRIAGNFRSDIGGDPAVLH